MHQLENFAPSPSFSLPRNASQSRKTQLVTERERAEQATAEFTALVQQFANMAAKSARADLVAQRARPWWRRWWQAG